MKKILLSCLALGALAFSASAVEQTLTVTGTELGLKNSYSKVSYEDPASGLTITANGTSASGNIQLGANSKSGNWIAVTGNTNNYTIKSVEFTALTTTSSKTTTLSVYSNADAYADLDGAIKTAPAGTEVMSYTLAQNEEATEIANIDAPYFVAYNSTNGGQIMMTNIVITYDDGQSSDLLNPEISAVSPNKSVVYNGGMLQLPISDFFNNPHDLPLKFTSTNPYIAVAMGMVVVATPGTATITATFEGNEEYQKGSASVTITTISGVEDIAAFLALSVDTKAQFTNPVTVVYNGGKYLFVQDASGYLQLFNAAGAFPAYQPGQTLSGFEVVRGVYGNNPQGDAKATIATFPEEATGTATEIAPSVVNAADLTEADYNRYVQFEKVTLTQDNNKWYVGDVQLYDRFSLGLLSDLDTETEYNVTGIYVIYNTTKELYITAIAEATSVDPTPSFPTEITVNCDAKDVNIDVDDEEGIFIMATGKAAGEGVDFVIDIPEGWDGIFAYDSSIAYGHLRTAIDEDSDWQSLSDMMEYYKSQDLEYFTGNTITIPTDGKGHYYACMLYVDDKVYTGDAFMLFAQIEKDTTVGIEAVEASEADAVYYDLNGRRVAGKLLPGIYVKNVNGKVSKELVK